MRKIMKIILIFLLGFITPILIIFFLGGVIYVNSVDRLHSFDNVVVREVNSLIYIARITLLDLYQASSLSDGVLFDNLRTNINNFATSFGQRLDNLSSFRSDHTRPRTGLATRLQPYITKLQQFEIDFQRPNISIKEKIASIDLQLTNIDELIAKLKNSNISFTEEIQRLEEIKGNLVALKAALTLTDEEKAKLKESIVAIAEEVQSNLPDEINDQVGEIYQGDIEPLTPEQQIEILQAENASLTEQVTSLTTQLETANNEIVKLKDLLAKATTKIADLGKEIKTLRSDLEKSDAKNEVLKNQLADSIAEVIKLNAQIVVQEKAIERLSNTNISNKGDLDTLEQTNKTLEQQVVDLTQQVANLEQQVIELTEPTYTNFEEYVFDGTTAPIITDYTKQFDSSIISNITTTKVDNVYATITFTSDINFTTEQMNYITSLVTKQLALTTYESDITLTFMPNNISINLTIQ